MNTKILLLPIIGATTFFILLFTFTKLIGPIPFSVNSVTTTKSDTFQVSGEGKVTAVPDIAYVTVGIQANGSTVKTVQDQINSTTKKISDATKKLGVDAKDIQTTNYTINPNYDYTGGGQKITGYSANTNLSIKVKDIDKINEVIDASTANGANQVGGISFEMDDKTRAENEAREKAVEEAKRKAEQASRIAGFKLGRMINYSENFVGGPIPIPLRATSMGMAEEQTPTQVEPGSSEIVVTVTLSYEVL